MRCLILGGAGFLGSHIAEALVRRGHLVRIFDLPNVNLRNLRECIGAVEVVGGDFYNPQDVAPALEQVDMVVHLVCTTLPGPSNENPVYDVETNVVGTLRLLEAALQKGVRKILFASSGGTVYGIPKRVPIPESHPTDPLCSYGITKLAVEKYLSLFHRLHGLDYTVLRFANPYGPRQRLDHVQGAVTVFLGKTWRDEPITIWGDGSVARDYFYISDLVDAVLKAVEGPCPSRIYNIGSGKAVSLLDLLSHIREVTGRSPQIRFTPSRKLDVPVNCLDVSLAARELGWTPRMDLREGLVRTWEWIQEGR